MKIISKIIAWILSIIFVFIALNLIVWLIKYGGISNYSDFLNKKDRNTTISQISIKDPKSIFSLFYWEYTPKDKNTESLEQDFTNQQAEEDIPTDEEIDTVNETNFIDDFDEFFGSTDLQKDSQESYDDTEWAFIAKDSPSQPNTEVKTVWQQLLDKFNQ